MAKVTWTFQALEDLEEIAEYQARYSEKYAALLIDTIFENTENLEQFPFSGRMVPELNLAAVRELILKNTGSFIRSPIKMKFIFSLSDHLLFL